MNVLKSVSYTVGGLNTSYVENKADLEPITRVVVPRVACLRNHITDFNEIW